MKDHLLSESETHSRKNYRQMLKTLTRPNRHYGRGSASSDDPHSREDRSSLDPSFNPEELDDDEDLRNYVKEFKKKVFLL